MSQQINAGNVVLLNGTSSAGKTSIALALQEIMDAPYVYAGIDHTPRVHRKFHVVSDGANPATSNYFLLVYGGGDVRRETKTVSGEIVYSGGTDHRSPPRAGRPEAAGRDVSEYRRPRRGRSRRGRRRRYL